MIRSLAGIMGIAIDNVRAEEVTKKRQSDLESELSVAVPTTEGEPPAAEVVRNFISNSTAIEQLQEEVPEVEDIVANTPLPSMIDATIVWIR
jgi:hypothetical protein